MAVKIGVGGGPLTFGVAGSFFGSEVLVNAAVGPNYLSAASVTLLSSAMPCMLMASLPGTSQVTVQYTPDAGVTWRALNSCTMFYADGSTTRLFNSGAGSLNAFLTPLKQAS